MNGLYIVYDFHCVGARFGLAHYVCNQAQHIEPHDYYKEDECQGGAVRETKEEEGSVMVHRSKLTCI